MSELRKPFFLNKSHQKIRKKTLLNTFVVNRLTCRKDEEVKPTIKGSHLIAKRAVATELYDFYCD